MVKLRLKSNSTPEPVKRGRGRPRKNPLPEADTTVPSSNRKVRLNISARNLVIILIIIGALAASLYFYMKYQNSQDKLNNPGSSSSAETDSLVKKVGKIAVLPTGETPTVATVSDVTKLSGQSFFTNAKNGDKVLIYSQAKRAVLYRPSSNQIVNIAPLNLSATQSGTTGQ